MNTVDPVHHVKFQMNTEKNPSDEYPYELPCDVEPDEETEEEEISLEDALTSL